MSPCRGGCWGWRKPKRGNGPAPPSPASDLFAEGPEGWYFDTVRSGESTFDIILAEKPPKASLPIDNVVLTVNEGDRAFEATTRLDAPPPKP